LEDGIIINCGLLLGVFNYSEYLIGIKVDVKYYSGLFKVDVLFPLLTIRRVFLNQRSANHLWVSAGALQINKQKFLNTTKKHRFCDDMAVCFR
jgi:hypothetical protein